jgi:hypothetical protein
MEDESPIPKRLRASASSSGRLRASPLLLRAFITHILDSMASASASTSTVQLSTPAPALPAASSSSTPIYTNPIDDFFGATLSSTSESRHDRRISSDSSLEQGLGLPPAYPDMPPPEYTKRAEPDTLAMYLFKFGFGEFLCYVPCIPRV